MAWGGGYLLSGVGDRARAMGGAFTGLADDWSSAYYNPAGGAFLTRSEIQFTAAALTPRLDYVPGLNLGGWRFNNLPDEGSAYYNIDKTYVVPQFGGYGKLPSAWGANIGIAFFTQLDNNLAWNLFNPYYDSAEPFVNPDTESDINVWTTQPTVGYQAVQDHLALGAGMVINYTEIRQHRVQIVDDPGDPFGLPPPDLGVAFVDGFVEGDGWGVGYNLGALAKLEQWSFGLSFQSKIVHKLDGTSSTRFWSWTVAGRGEQTDPLLEQDLLNGVVHRAEQGIDLEFTTPPRLSAGVAFRASDRLRFTGDLAFAWYSHVPGLIVTENDLTRFKFGDPQDVSTTVDVYASERYEWKDQYRIAVGAEWDASSRLHLRSGFFYEPSAIETTGLTPLYTDIGNKLSPSIGLGVDVGGYTFGYTHAVVFFEDRKASEWTATNLPGTYGGIQHESFVSLRYRW
jgi:long-chain fatty acid transport protein